MHYKLNDVPPCPFCGQTKTLTLEPCYQEDVVTCYRVVCDASTGGPGGCGASAGCGDYQEDAIVNWCMRASTNA